MTEPMTWQEALDAAHQGSTVCPVCDESLTQAQADRGILGGWWPCCSLDCHDDLGLLRRTVHALVRGWGDDGDQ